ncbi:MAG: DMT family transporter [Magnetovibrio sp.]|nr:DMT family transporter [Magnetovibrio sp.]
MSDPDDGAVPGSGRWLLWERLPPNARGMLLMAVFACLVALLHVIVRRLSQDLHPMEIAFFRTVVPLFVLVPMLMRQGRGWWRSTRPGLQLVRGLLGGAAMVTWFYSLAMIPVGDATALSFSVVVFTSIGAVLFLGEKMGMRRWMAVLIGLIGTLIILRPGTQAMQLGALVALASSIFWSATLLVVKVLTRTESEMTIVFYSSMYFTLIAAVPAFYYWVWPTPEQFALLILVGLMALVAHLAMARAMKQAEATAIMPVDFTRLLWAAAAGYLWFGEFPDLWTWVGGTVVFASTIYITYRESRKQPAPGRPAVPSEQVR